MAFLIGLPHTGTLGRLTKPDPCGYGQQSDRERQIVEQISPVKASWLTEEPERPFQTGRLHPLRRSRQRICREWDRRATTDEPGGREKGGQTRDEAFNAGSESKDRAPMMHQTAKFKYLDADTLQVLEMPYAGKDLSMVVLLPKKVNGLADLEKSLSADKLAGWLGKVREQEVIVTLPKFKTTSEFSMNSTLSALGMKKAFQMPGADFSGINGKEDLYITAVVHKAFVDVNEEGTEAAGATGVVVGVKSAPAPKPVFRADHPFVFLIRDTRNDSVLFLGRIVNPSK